MKKHFMKIRLSSVARLKPYLSITQERSLEKPSNTFAQNRKVLSVILKRCLVAAHAYGGAEAGRV